MNMKGLCNFHVKYAIKIQNEAEITLFLFVLFYSSSILDGITQKAQFTSGSA